MVRAPVIGKTVSMKGCGFISSKTKIIGEIGEHVVMTEFLKRGIMVSRPVGELSEYDLIVDVNHKLYKAQVKSTEFVREGKMIFQTNITNPFKKTKRMYTDDEIDLFILYCHENGYVGIVTISECTSSGTVIRLSPPANCQKAKIKLAENYQMDVVLPNL